MKILTIINISNNDDILCDSGLIFQRILAKEFIKEDIEYVILGPEKGNFKNITLDNIKMRYCDLGITRYESRFSFQWNAIKKIILEEQPDIIFNNQVELTAAIRSLLVTENMNNTKIVSYCHYPALWGFTDKPEIDHLLIMKILVCL